MRLLMVSGDRQVCVGERGPFHTMQREFSRYFERVDVICPRPEGRVTVVRIHDNVHFHPASVSRRGMLRYVAAKGAELLRAHGHALITSHDYGWFYNGVGSAHLARITGVPYLSEIHHIPGVPVAGGLRDRFDKWVARVYVRWARNKALAFRVVNGEEMLRQLLGWGVPPQKILVLPSLYIDLEVFHPPPRRVRPRQDVVFVGRMVGNKGVERIVDALAILERGGRETRALFVGKGPRLERVRARAATRGARVNFVQWIDTPADLASVYRESRVCVCSSTCEGGPRFAVEAMACGTPVVSTPVGVMSELLSDGRAGCLTGFDAHGLAAALGGILEDEDLRAAMGREAAERARPFEYARAIGVYANSLRRLAGHEERSP